MRHWMVVFFILTSSIEPAQAAGSLCAEVFSTKRGELAVPVLAWENLNALKPAGRGNYSAQWTGQTVFVKRLRENSSENSWLEFLNSLGLGVRTYGELLHEGQRYLVTEHFAGVNSQMPMMAPADFQITKSMALEIRRQAELLATHGVIPVDLQFQMTREGQIKIIDPELFRQASNAQSALKETQSILNNLFFVWSIEGKWAP